LELVSAKNFSIRINGSKHEGIVPLSVQAFLEDLQSGQYDVSPWVTPRLRESTCEFFVTFDGNIDDLELAQDLVDTFESDLREWCRGEDDVKAQFIHPPAELRLTNILSG